MHFCLEETASFSCGGRYLAGLLIIPCVHSVEIFNEAGSSIIDNIFVKKRFTYLGTPDICRNSTIYVLTQTYKSDMRQHEHLQCSL